VTGDHRPDGSVVPEELARFDNVIVLPGVDAGPAPSEPAVKDPEDPSGTDELDQEKVSAPETGLLAAAVEAVLFTQGEPLSFARLGEILCQPDAGNLRAALQHLRSSYDQQGHGLMLVQVAGGWQIRTHPRLSPWVVRARGGRALRLSRAALETLAIVAFRQPVTRAEIEDIRGVEPGPVLRLLLERSLIRLCGARDEPGRPLTYGTTPRFLELFGLGDLSDLPALRDLQEVADPPASEGTSASALLDGIWAAPPVDSPRDGS
jgi:segregation and condensation protein B